MGTMPGVGSAGGVPFSVQPPVATDGSSIAPGSVVQFSDASGRVIGQGRTDAQGFTTIRDQNPPGRPAEQRSLFQRMKTAVGIGPAAQSFVGGLPVVGEPFRSSFPETAQITQDRRYLNNATNDLVTALQNNPKYPEGEREAIRAEVGNLAATFTNPSAAMDAAYAVDLSLEQRLAKAEKVINDPSNPEDLRMEAKAVYNAVKQFRENVLNVPRPKNNAELREMINTDRIVVGEDFFTPEGQRKTLTKEGVDMLFRAK